MIMVHPHKKYKSWKLKRYVKKWGSKNLGYFQTFDKGWFGRNQTMLIWLCNHFIFKYWFRWILRIHNDVKWDERIVSLEPNNYKVFCGFEGKQIKLKADFRTHNKFSKRIYHAFKYVWWIAHAWDWLVADRFIPELSFGLLTLTVYPNYNGELGATSSDGHCRYQATSETWSTLVAGNGTIASSADVFFQLGWCASSTTTNEFTLVSRGQILFDTNALGASASISGVVNSYYGDLKSDDLGAPTIHIVASNPISNTVVNSGDYQLISSTSFGSLVYSSMGIGSYNDITLNASGIAAVSKTGITKFGSRLAWDIDNSFGGSWISSDNTYMRVKSADETGNTKDPKLVVTYITGWGQKFLGESAFAKAIGVS